MELSSEDFEKVKELSCQRKSKRNQLFKNELRDLLNRYSMDNECDMPDFLLAEMLIGFIKATGGPVKKTLDWHGCDSICHPRKKL